ncbi:substrate-binding periplasmic protein [Alkalimarinus alittae]|uniref:Transporter substrate-binding domain-containing protein n=1 Tax=Alkalimarinus alittae TaxID=2961619 RepID=A0ABY6N6G9_9ALTE|nr:transporter substrate-binding domain-containing protein [Alkalimarinus alittae]UZE97723.1 transporter substrate-binding domain-containing protein [Alkalimarinus alittae]
MLRITKGFNIITLKLLTPSRLGIITLLLFSLATTGNTQTVEKLKVAYVEFPPIEYKDENNQPAGSFIEITKAVLNNAEIEYEFVFLPIARAYLYLKEGNIDMWPGLSGIPSLQGHVLESKSVPSNITLSAWYLKGTPPISHIKELSGTHTILINGYTYAGLIDKITHEDFGMIALFTPTHKSGLKMLQLQRGEYFLDYNEPINAYLRNNPVDDLQHSVLNKRNSSFIVSKKYSHAEELIKKLDQSYHQLITNGTITPNTSH